jgi:hypothetical protein
LPVLVDWSEVRRACGAERLDMRIRAALWTAALALASSLVVAPAAADDPPGKQPVKDAKEAAKDAKDKLRDARKDAKEATGDDKKDAKQDVKDAKKDLREARQKVRETRKDRREELRKAVKDKWGGDLVKKPKVRAELALHAQRMAKINHMEFLAKDNDKDQLLERIQKLRDKEKARHEKRMEALKAKGGEE